ncbi:hypothetical protein [Nocardia sp. NPDC058705]|uniref:hypothetical protein n=1 Tax=Nocardia sp. NPDC058705 TaxID=3346609 RepID=UPI0036B3AA42
MTDQTSSSPPPIPQPPSAGPQPYQPAPAPYGNWQQPGFGYPTPTGQQPNPGYPPTPRPPRRWIWPVVAAVTAVLAVVGWATAGTLLLEEDPPATVQPADPSIARDAAREAARTAACDLTNAMSSYDHTNLGGYKSAIDQWTTGQLRTDFDSGWPALQAAMTQAQVTSQVEHLDCLYKSGEGDRMTVVAVFQQVRTSLTQTTPQKMMMIVYNSMVLTDGRWLVEKIDSPFVK